MTDNFIGLLLGLGSALIWGGGDFSGGMATRHLNPFQALALSSLVCLVAMLMLSMLLQEAWLKGINLVWAGSAGIIGAVGIAALYKGLSMRAMAIVAPTSAVVGTAIPVIVSMFTEGLPQAAQAFGILLGALGIWLVSRSPGAILAEAPRALGLAVFSGLCFGSFFVMIAQVQTESIFAPLAISKTTATLFAVTLLPFLHLRFPSPRLHPLAMLAGLLDAGGNVFYLLAARYTRMDIAAVLASMGLSVTVLLSALIMREPVSKPQRFGVILCIAATILLASN